MSPKKTEKKTLHPEFFLIYIALVSAAWYSLGMPYALLAIFAIPIMFLLCSLFLFLSFTR